jgi:hypothetical protein
VRSARLSIVQAMLPLLLTACDVSLVGDRPHGIETLADLDTQCGRGFLVAQSDYLSSNVSAFDWRGNTLSSSLLNSGSSEAGLVQAFSGDVVLPTEHQRGDRFVLIDRYPQSTLSFVELSTARISAQLDVSTGFAANPHDYVQLDERRALVTRFDTNQRAGNVPNDAGGDVLLIDPQIPAIHRSIDLAKSIPNTDADLSPHPDRLLTFGSRTYVVVSLYSADYQKSGHTFLTVLSNQTLEIETVVELPGVEGCSGIALSPSGDELAIACSGSWGNVHGASPDRSAIIGLGTAPPHDVRWRFSAQELPAPAAFAFAVHYLNEHDVLFVRFGKLTSSGRALAADQLLSYDTRTHGAQILHVTEGEAFVLGDVRCLSACGYCAVARAGVEPGLLLFRGSPQGPRYFGKVPMQDGTGLPPRWLGTF